MSAPSAMRWRVESWDPGYGASTEDQAELGRSDARVTPDVEVPEARWRAIDPDPKAAGWAAVLFVDGVRRIDAMAWISEPDGGADGVAADGSETGAAADGAGSGAAALALCASYAAGVVRCRPGGADLVAAEVRRGLFSTAEHATDVVTTAGRYQRVHTAQRGEPVADLSLAVQRALGDVEAVVAATARNAVAGSNGTNGSDDGDDLLVLDGPLRGRQHLPRVLGFIKTHRSEYLPPALHRVVGTLAPGQRTPVFGLGTSWQRHTWYLKLPGSAAPWAGVVRVECSAELSVAQVVELADRSAPMLCRYASTEYKDSRAPQNLYPIAGLERALRRRLGDQALLYRAIRRASAGLNSS